MADPLAWMDRARCKGADLRLFFPEHKPGAKIRTAKFARRYCEACPVQRDCLAYALRVEGSQPSSNRAGVYGNAVPHQRARMVGAAT